MSREIKFRAWDEDRKTMHPTDSVWSDPFIRFSGQVVLLENNPFDGKGTYEDKTNKWILMQFTGLKDAKGVDIWEGDIIQSFDSTGHKIIHEVFYNKEEAAFNIRLAGSFFNNSGRITQPWIDEFKKEVIGNIYKTPELQS